MSPARVQPLTQRLLRAGALAICSLPAVAAQGEIMRCDAAKSCTFVCFAAGGSTSGDRVQGDADFDIDRVQVSVLGHDNILYTTERIDRSGSLPTHHPVGSFVLPTSFSCQLSPSEAVAAAAEPLRAH